MEKLFLVVWPPLGETERLGIDVSFGFMLNRTPDRLCIVTTNKEDMWTPSIHYSDIPRDIYPGSLFPTRIKEWMDMSMKSNCLQTEYYDVTKVALFKNIASSRILSIELIGIVGEISPFGVKLVFSNDYILSTPISDGNTVETLFFNRNDNIQNFKTVGVIEHTTL